MSRFAITSLRGKINVKHGFAFEGEYFSNKGEYIILTPGNFKEEGGFKVDLNKAKFYTGEIPLAYVCKKGDLIVAMTEQAEGLLGSSAIVPEGNRFLHNQRIGLVTTNANEINKTFLYYLFNTKSVRKQIRLSSSGSKVKHTSPDRIYDVKVNLPSLQIQEQIASILSSLDLKIELNNKINAELEAMAKTIYDYWFVQFDFPNAKGKPYKSSGGKMIWNTDLKKDIPDGWEIKKMNKLLVKNNLKYDQKGEGSDTIDLSVMPSGTMCLYDRNHSSSFSTNLFYLKKYDILFGAIRPYLLKAGFAPFDGLITGTVHSYRTVKPEYYNFSLLTIIQDSIFNHAVSNSKGTKMPVIGSDDLLSYKVAFNEDVISHFNNHFSFKELIANNINENQQLASLRDWLLPMLMNGQVKVGDAEKMVEEKLSMAAEEKGVYRKSKVR